MAKATSDQRSAGGSNVDRPLHRGQRVIAAPIVGGQAGPGSPGTVAVLSRGGKVSMLVLADGRELLLRWSPADLLWRCEMDGVRYAVTPA